MVFKELTDRLRAINPIFKKISEGKELSFEEAWSLVVFFKQNKDFHAFDGVELVPESKFPQLLEEARLLNNETNGILHLYYVKMPEFAALNAKAIPSAIFKTISSIGKKQELETITTTIRDYFDIDKFRSFDTEFRKTSSLLRLKLSALVMMISHIDTVSKVLIDNLVELQNKQL